MKRVVSVLLGGLFALAPSVWAQWLDHPEKNIPRNADGSFKVDAPAPRLRGKPSLEGLWKSETWYNDLTDDGNNIGEMGKKVKGGTPLQPWARELVEQHIARGRIDDPSSFCLPTGLIGQHLFSLYRLLQWPDRIVMLYENGTSFRQIFLDGRPLPQDPQPTYMGYSVGHWEGDALVVESTGFNGKSWIDGDGRPITEQLRLTERFRRLSFGLLEHEMTFDDPGAYTKPWTVSIQFHYNPDSELMEGYCEDNKFVEQLQDAGIKPAEPTTPP